MSRWVLWCLLLAGLAIPAGASAQAIPVELVRTEAGWQLLRGGEPYLIRGAGGDASLEQLAAAGANSVRTWGADDLDARLDQAHALGLSVTVGIWLGHERHGFDYDDPDQVKAQLERARQTVLRYKDHPAVLLWGLGNEMEGFEAGDDPAIWAAVEQVAAMTRELDPAHPTMTVTADIGGERVASINAHCPSIDIHGINSYGGALSIAERYRAAGGTRPYVLTEFGPPGVWQIPKNDWGAPPEPTSTEKAAFYRRAYQAAVLDAPGLALGSYAFAWGSKMEATATWYGMFLPDGTRLGAIDTMTELWSGRPPADRAPTVEPLVLEGADPVEPGDVVSVRAVAADPEGGPLTATWTLRRESSEYLTGGDFRATPPAIAGAVLEADGLTARVRLPEAPGGYRLYLVVRDGAGNGATANVPLRVRGEPRALLPVAVYEDGFAGMPWAPSGWMGNHEALTLDGELTEGCHEGACIRMHYAGRGDWVGVAWQHPPNNWGDQPGGHDLTGARFLEVWARGERGGERIDIGVGLLGSDVDHPDSGKATLEGIVLKPRWKRYRIPLRRVDLSSLKTGFFISIGGELLPVTVYLDRIRFVE